ncbi:hypothetical protein [Aestuariimicrobium ganziense]|uniref:hypothetical protein n=1 Tax=Aestuariimicrobium ganziense TaxID=2773677 RepID=UPI001940B1C4|nr:hypothetical protein [Aestuariimicrobium ganziense]
MTQVQRGAARIPDPRVWGTFIGASLASVFVHSNRNALPDPWPMVALLAWVLAFAWYLWTTLVVPRRFGPPPAVGPKSGLVYLASVAAMIAVIQVGRLLANRADRPELGVSVIVFAVGAHFFPFAKAFVAPFFTRLGWVVTTMGVLSFVLGLFWPTAALAVAVVNGVVMVAMIGGYAWADRASADEVAASRAGAGTERGTGDRVVAEN